MKTAASPGSPDHVGDVVNERPCVLPVIRVLTPQRPAVEIRGTAFVPFR
jgi:hypothetical protein